MTSRIGVEEEFHLVDLQTRGASPAVDAMLDQSDGESFAPELQRSLVEANTAPCESLDELRAELCRLRRRWFWCRSGYRGLAGRCARCAAACCGDVVAERRI